MKESVIHNLLDKIVHQLSADLPQVIAILQERLLIIDPTAVDVFHHQDMDCSKLLIKLRSPDKIHILVPAGKLLHVRCLGQEVHLIPRDRPHLIKHKIQVRHPLDADRRKELHRLVEQGDIPRHRLIDTFPLYFYDNVLTCAQDRPVHLGNRSRALRHRIDLREYSLPRPAIGLLDHPYNFFVRHWSHIGTEFHQFIAVALREDIRVH